MRMILFKLMNKRKISVQELKRGVSKNKKLREINVKYQTVLSYFKQKETKEMEIFKVDFPPLLDDFTDQLTSAELFYKLETSNKDPLKEVVVQGGTLKLDSFDLRGLSKEYPIQQICDCLVIFGGQRKTLEINKSKLMIFFKQLRMIYSDFCYCVGEKCIIQSHDLKTLYEHFKAQWMRNQEKGRLGETERIEKKICRSLYFVGIIIQNNIFAAIDQAERKKKQDQSELGTKSQRKKNIKGINQPVSSTYSFGSLQLISNMSTRLKSQKSNEEDLNARKISDYSQKSEKIISKSRHNLWDKVELGVLQFRLPVQEDFTDYDFQKYQINYLSNDVENILIENAFKIQKFKDSCDRYDIPIPLRFDNTTRYEMSPRYDLHSLSNQYCFVNYAPEVAAQPQTETENEDLSHLKRSLGCINLVETRKTTSRCYERM